MNDLISRQDAINAIKARFGNVVVIEEATKALEGVPEAESDWIPVEKELPKNDDSVLITHSQGVSKAWWNGRFWTNGMAMKLKTVLAWKPLPKPYRKEGD